MTTHSEGLVEGGAERRLHPWSWLFVLIQQVKSFALPLVVLLFTGRGNSWELWGLVGAGVLVLVSLGQYFTYRFRVDADGIVIRSGLLQKSLRNIPFTRIHNVALHQTLLHRVFGVAEVKLESAGGMTPEGQMRVLSLADAHALEELVRIHGKAQAAPDLLPLLHCRDRLVQRADLEDVRIVPAFAQRGVGKDELERRGQIEQAFLVAHNQAVGVVIGLGAAVGVLQHLDRFAAHFFLVDGKIAVMHVFGGVRHVQLLEQALVVRVARPIAVFLLEHLRVDAFLRIAFRVVLAVLRHLVDEEQ